MTAPTGYNLVFSDDFDGNSINTTYWNIDKCSPVWACGGQISTNRACALPENIIVANGEAALRCKKESTNVTCSSCSGAGTGSGNRNYTMAWLRTEGNKQCWKYGYFEIECMMEKQNDLWQAFWMMSQYDSTNPFSLSNPNWEVDIFEYRDRYNDASPYPKVFHTVMNHSGTSCPSPTNPHGSCPSISKNYNIDYGNTYHVFGFEWTSTFLSFTIDGIEKWRVTNSAWIPQNKMAVLLSNQLIGCTLTNPVDFKIKYFKVYQKPNTGSIYSHPCYGTAITPYIKITNPVNYITITPDNIILNPSNTKQLNITCNSTDWQHGTVKRITWDTNLTTGKVNILYVKNNISNQITNQSQMPDVSQKYYDWAIPDNQSLIGTGYTILIAYQLSPYTTNTSNSFNII